MVRSIQVQYAVCRQQYAVFRQYAAVCSSMQQQYAAAVCSMQQQYVPLMAGVQYEQYGPPQAHRCWAGPYVFRGHYIDTPSSDSHTPDEYACRLTFMHINALSSVHASAHERTQFNACPAMPIDAGLVHTCLEITASMRHALIAIRMTSTHADSHSCTLINALISS